MKIGIKENVANFMLLVLVNFFVGSMVGLERTILPVLGETNFGLLSSSAAISFIVSFGFSKAIVNYFAGGLADRLGRKKVLLIGWIFGLFVPLIIIFASSWWMIVLANIFLGINQGLAWSMTVNMKIDLSKSTQRGLAVGINEFAGYTGVAIMAAISGYASSNVANQQHVFLIGVVIAVFGLVLSLVVRDTEEYIRLQTTKNQIKKSLSAKEVFKETTYKDKNLSSITLAGLSTNFKDGMAWGLFPIFLAGEGLSITNIGIIIAVYPASWGFFQLFTGGLSDKYGRKWFIVGGMLLQAFSLWMNLIVNHFSMWLLASILLGIGTAMVYPTLQASISDVARPEWRASSMGVYRFWRDSGYAFGALFAGILNDLLTISWAIGIVAVLPLTAGLITLFRLNETLKITK